MHVSTKNSSAAVQSAILWSPSKASHILGERSADRENSTLEVLETEESVQSVRKPTKTARKVEVLPERPTASPFLVQRHYSLSLQLPSKRVDEICITLN